MSVRPRTLVSQSNTMALGAVIDRLGQNAIVDGLIMVGSTGKESLSPASDYDLIVVLSDMPVPLHVALTYIDRRLTDIIFFSVSAIDRILTGASEQDGADTMEGKLIRWLQAGTIAFDRSGRLQRAQRKVRTGQSLKSATDGEIYAAWFGINYNVKQTRRMLASADPVYQTAVDFRLLYCLAELWTQYFRVRRLPWEGEKGAARYLAAQDPAYLDLFQRCLAETDRAHKVDLYEQLAALTIAPGGEIWQDDATAIQFELAPGQELSSDTVETGLAFWDSLLGGPA